jgi:low affinity Fe/Cu permease
VVVDRSDAAATRRDERRQSWFERFVEQANHAVSRAPFFYVCVAIVLAWLVSLPLWTDLKVWQAAIHTVSSVLSLLLLVLLENAGRRSEEAAQEKLNVIAEALSDLMEARTHHGDEQLAEAAGRLRDAVGLEARH